MKKVFEDILYAFKIGLYIFIPVFVLGLIIGFILYGPHIGLDIIVACRVCYVVGVIGMALAALSFIKQDLMRPLNYQKDWEMYFSKLNLAHVSFLIGFFILIVAAVIEVIVFYL